MVGTALPAPANGVSGVSGVAIGHSRLEIPGAFVGWANDIYAGADPVNPVYGIYGNPNDGSYIANQSIVMGQADTTTIGVEKIGGNA